MYDVYYPPSGARVGAVKQWNVGANYDFKAVKLHAAYGQSIGGRLNGVGVLDGLQTDGGDTNTNGAVVYRPGTRTDQWMLGITVSTGPAAKVFASVQQVKPGAAMPLVAERLKPRCQWGTPMRFLYAPMSMPICLTWPRLRCSKRPVPKSWVLA